jgi:hypothetical protein
MPNEFPGREVTNLVALFQRAHNKVVSLARMDDQIAAMVVQHERLQEEIRAVQNEINHEFERALKFNQAPSKLPNTIGVPQAVTTPALITPAPAPNAAPAPSTVQFSVPAPSNGDSSQHDDFGGEVIPLARG